MSDTSERAADPSPPAIDENGVDLAQIRSMLDATPADRLERVFSFTRSLLAVRDPGARAGSR